MPDRNTEEESINHSLTSDLGLRERERDLQSQAAQANQPTTYVLSCCSAAGSGDHGRYFSASARHPTAASHRAYASPAPLTGPTRSPASAPTSAERDEEAEKAEKPSRSHAASAGGRHGAALPSRPVRLGRESIAAQAPGLMGFVDLWLGIVLVNLLQEEPAPSYIQLPPPLRT
uniref:Uncharacterized protein n=1 Tax=Oryza nivara TaxID=4536 RepID=A0A0E0GFM3_ORYNI